MQNIFDTKEILHVGPDQLWSSIVNERKATDTTAIYLVRGLEVKEPVEIPRALPSFPVHPEITPIIPEKPAGFSATAEGQARRAVDDAYGEPNPQIQTPQAQLYQMHQPRQNTDSWGIAA